MLRSYFTLLSNRLSIFDLINALRWISELSCASCNFLLDHNLRVAFISAKIAEMLQIPHKELRIMVQAALLHDIGFVFMKCICPSLEEMEYMSLVDHSEFGSWVVSHMPFLDDHERVSEITRYHHLDYEEGLEKEIPVEAFIIKAANNLDFIQSKYATPHLFKDEIVEKIKSVKVPPEILDCIEELILNSPLYFWFELKMNNGNIVEYLKNLARWEELVMDLNTLNELGRSLLTLVDFRSTITSTHSTRVAAVAAYLNKRLDEPEYLQALSRVAGYLHDIGKLVVPLEVLEKPGRLTREEYSVIQSHVYYTYLFLRKANIRGRLLNLASFHHERIDGSGYPFGLNKNQLTIPERIMQVADVTAALCEKRPYKRSFFKRTGTGNTFR